MFLDTPVTDQWVDRYLKLLGLPKQPPGLDPLAHLTRAHLLTVPFVNCSAILRRSACAEALVPLLDAEQVLAAWEERRSGGVCFEIAGMVVRLLTALGYKARSVLADARYPDGHQGILIMLNDQRYLVDVQNGAPCFDPIPMAQGPVEIHAAGLGYRFRAGSSSDEFLQERQIDGEWQQFCTYKLGPPDPRASNAAYQWHHTPGLSWVVDTITIVRCHEDIVYRFRDGELVRYSATGKIVEFVNEIPATQQMASEIFGLPALPMAGVVRAAEELKLARQTEQQDPEPDGGNGFPNCNVRDSGSIRGESRPMLTR